MGLIDRIDGAVGLVRAMTDVARSGKDSAALIVDLAEQLQSIREELLAVRQEVTALEKEKLELAERLAEIADFDRQRDQYVEATLSTGASVYMLAGARQREVTVEQPVDDPGRREDQRPVYFCANCFDQRRRTRLQPAELKHRVDTYSCQACGAKVLIPNDREPTVVTVPVTRRRVW